MEQYVKRTDYSVNYEFVNPGDYAYNYLEDCEYTCDPEKGNNVKLTGTVGEEWLTSEEKLRNTYYCEDDGTAWPREDAGVIWMRPAEGQEVVYTSWGDVLTANLPYNSRGDAIPHGDGDMVAYADNGGYPDENDCWIINGAVFANTYRLA